MNTSPVLIFFLGFAAGMVVCVLSLVVSLLWIRRKIARMDARAAIKTKGAP